MDPIAYTHFLCARMEAETRVAASGGGKWRYVQFIRHKGNVSLCAVTGISATQADARDRENLFNFLARNFLTDEEARLVSTKVSDQTLIDEVVRKLSERLDKAAVFWKKWLPRLAPIVLEDHNTWDFLHRKDRTMFLQRISDYVRNEKELTLPISGDEGAKMTGLLRVDAPKGCPSAFLHYFEEQAFEPWPETPVDEKILCDRQIIERFEREMEKPESFRTVDGVFNDYMWRLNNIRESKWERYYDSLKEFSSTLTPGKEGEHQSKRPNMDLDKAEK